MKPFMAVRIRLANYQFPQSKNNNQTGIHMNLRQTKELKVLIKNTFKNTLQNEQILFFFPLRRFRLPNKT